MTYSKPTKGKSKKQLALLVILVLAAMPISVAYSCPAGYIPCGKSSCCPS